MFTFLYQKKKKISKVCSTNGQIKHLTNCLFWSSLDNVQQLFPLMVLRYQIPVFKNLQLWTRANVCFSSQPLDLILILFKAGFREQLRVREQLVMRKLKIPLCCADTSILCCSWFAQWANGGRDIWSRTRHMVHHQQKKKTNCVQRSSFCSKKDHQDVKISDELLTLS